MTTIGQTPAWMDNLNTLIDSRVASAVGQKPEDAVHRFGTITSTSPIRVQLDGDSAVLPYAPPCLYPPKSGDRVLCVVFGTKVAILGPVAAGTDTGWQTLTGWGDGWGSGQYADSEDAVWRVRGDEVTVEGLALRWGSGAGFGVIASGLPMPRSGAPTLIGFAQYSTGGTCPLMVNYSGQLLAEGLGATGNCNTGDWVRLSGRYTI